MGLKPVKVKSCESDPDEFLNRKLITMSPLRLERLENHLLTVIRARRWACSQGEEDG